ncbi:MAG TPA: sodium-dependent transporter [Firmicutes bacterium]|nr:sodium-dependent transporter [Bacillota bacterium]
MGEQTRETFGSRMGFIFAAAGSAIGLGNIWRFPYLVGVYGGAAFLVVYLAIVIIIGVVCFIAEVSLGRHTRQSNVGAFKALKPSWAPVGLIGITAGFMILSFYSVVGGWTIYYFFRAVAGFKFADPSVSADLFVGFISNPLSPLLFHALFMGATIWIVYQGIQGGIEKYSNIMMPALFVIIVILAIRSMTLPGGGAGLEFYLKPDFSKIDGETLLAALGQVFFSLSLGMGSILTYGSYLSKDENIPYVCTVVPLMDTLVAFLAGLVVFPAVFAYGFEPGSGGGLAFITLPAVFNEMPAGNLFGGAFFFLLFLAALTSAISLLEPVAAYMIEEHGWERKKAVLIMGTIIFVVGIACSLSNGVWSGFLIAGKNFFDFMDFVSGNIFLPVSGMLTAIFVAWVWGSKNALQEATNDGTVKFGWGNLWANVLIKYVAPILIAVVFLSSVGLIKL